MEPESDANFGDHNLPEEILLEIFSFLQIENLLSASLVSTK